MEGVSLLEQDKREDRGPWCLVGKARLVPVSRPTPRGEWPGKEFLRMPPTPLGPKRIYSALGQGLLYQNRLPNSWP